MLPRRISVSRRRTTDSSFYGATDTGNLGGVDAGPQSWHGQPFSAEVTLPPLGVVWLVPDADAGDVPKKRI